MRDYLRSNLLECWPSMSTLLLDTDFGARGTFVLKDQTIEVIYGSAVQRRCCIELATVLNKSKLVGVNATR